VKRLRELILANLAALLVLLVALLVGWWEAAGFGLAVLVIMDLLVVVRERQARFEGGDKDDDEGLDA
jgi:hypothetical protein